MEVKKVFSKVKPEIVVHAASLTDVDRCETDKELASKINVEGTRNVTEQCSKTGAFILYISTDYVFSGEKGFYNETDERNPVNYYGLTKAKAEDIIRNLFDNFCIARTCVIYGTSPATGKTNFALWLLNNLRLNKKVKIVADQRVTPTLNTNLANMTLEIAERKLRGIYHVSGATRVSRFEYAIRLAETFELNPTFLTPTTLADMSWIAKRPKDSSLDTLKAQNSLSNKPLKLNEALEQLKQELSASIM